jgi:hypothetical protein
LLLHIIFLAHFFYFQFSFFNIGNLVH